MIILYSSNITTDVITDEVHFFFFSNLQLGREMFSHYLQQTKPYILQPIGAYTYTCLTYN